MKRSAWVSYLVDQAGLERCRAEELLIGRDRPRYDELERLERTLGVAGSSLEEVNLVERDEVDVLHKNLARLVDSLPNRGGQQQLAQSTGLNSNTISRWYRGEQRPTETNRKTLRDYFGIPEDTDLRTDPIFLSLKPIGKAEQRAWLHEQIDQLNAPALRALFPALERLLSGQ